jgi:hypothetical protein
MTAPTAFISYAWESEEIRNWVKSLAAQLRSDGIETLLDQWELVLGDQIPQFMERSVRNSDFVLIVCTPAYRVKSDGRIGGVGYEGDVMTAEIATGTDRRKFIPLLRSDTWIKAAPSWLRGSYYLDARGDLFSKENYHELVETLLGKRDKAPSVVEVKSPESEVFGAVDGGLAEISSPLETYMRARAWLARKSSNYPIAKDPSKVGWYSYLSKSGGGYFYDAVLEYRVWVHPHAGGPNLQSGDDYFCAFPSYEEALEFSHEMPGAEKPLALILQNEYVNEPRVGVFEHVVDKRITEWQVEWLSDIAKRRPTSIMNFLEERLSK